MGDKGRFCPLSERGMAGVLDDVDEVFRYSEEERPQDRAHEYLDWRGLSRTATDTAMQAAVRDLVTRAAGAKGAPPEAAAAEAIRAARERAQEFAVDLAVIERGLS